MRQTLSGAPGWAVMPLGPRSLLRLEVPKRPFEYTLMRVTAHKESTALAKLVNDLTIERARKWLASENQAFLESYLAAVTPEIMEKRRAGDVIEYTPPSEGDRRPWWELKPSPS